MILGTGIDLCEVDRIKSAIERYGDKFVQRIYTPKEIAYVQRKANKYERYAARFAAKEAGMKAIGTGWRGGITWQDFEVTNLASGRPTIAFHGAAARYAERMGVKRAHLSLTHTAQYGQAFLILEGE
ncbi:MAG: holo-[acyl-carrier-protein] synthase [Bryobacterales bacterium]|nr:holo-[acyl-carrier-protein] synthase [Bryobacterales bacterium]